MFYLKLYDINKGAYYLDYEFERKEIKFNCIYGFFHSIEKQNEYIRKYEEEIDNIKYPYFNLKIITCTTKFFLFKNYRHYFNMYKFCCCYCCCFALCLDYNYYN